jgi:hypothetical protein
MLGSDQELVMEKVQKVIRPLPLLVQAPGFWEFCSFYISKWEGKRLRGRICMRIETGEKSEV